MSLKTRLDALAQAVGADVKNLNSLFNNNTVSERTSVLSTGDWNFWDTPGYYQIAGGTWTNGPSGAYPYGQLVVTRNGGSVTTQVYYTHSEARAYIRTRYNASDWTPWTQVANLNDSMTPKAHTHDDRYYTKTESDGRYGGGTLIASNRIALTSSLGVTSGWALIPSASITFTAPSSGKVLVRLSARTSGNTSGDRQWRLNDVNTQSTIYATFNIMNSAQSSVQLISAATEIVSGLSPGAQISMEWRAQYQTVQNTQALIMEVFSA